MPSRTGSVRLRPSSTDDDPQRVLVVAEAAAEALAAGAVEHVLADVPERRVPDVVAEPDRLRQVLVEPQRPRDGARDPGDLERVREPRPVVVALGRDEHLRLVLEPPERLAVHDPVAVALERRPQAAVGLLALAARGIRRRGERRQPRGLARLLGGGEVAGDVGGALTPHILTGPPVAIGRLRRFGTKFLRVGPGAIVRVDDESTRRPRSDRWRG